ncbi:dienelactone hydrolase family protein [Pirellulaceae bacterium]|nr:dienelactone hydrolase family protein [Pirellulaceae bacterium]
MKRQTRILQPNSALLSIALCSLWVSAAFSQVTNEPYLGDVQPIEMKGDIASKLVSDVDKFLLDQIKSTKATRSKKWMAEYEASADKEKFFEAKRKRLAHILGVRDKRIPFDSPELISTLKTSSLIATSEKYDVHAIRFPVFDGVTVEGLLLEPKIGKPMEQMVVVPDADQTPEMLCGLTGDIPEERQHARRFANMGFRVIVPTIISREMTRRRGRANLTNREYLYRSAFEMGRHIAGYEVQKILAAIDWFDKKDPKSVLSVSGVGEGGLLAFYAAALDTRIDAVMLDDFLGNKIPMWNQPISRSLFGLENEFGEKQVLTLIAAKLIEIRVSKNSVKVDLPSEGGAPGKLVSRTADEIVDFVSSSPLKSIPDKKRTVRFFGDGIAEGTRTMSLRSRAPIDPTDPKQLLGQVNSKPFEKISSVDSEARMQRQINEIDRYNQKLLAESESVRKRFMKDLDTSSVDKFEVSAEKYRKIFAEEIIGQFDLPLKEMNPRVRKYCDKEKYVGYEIVLDVFDDVIAYGIILFPKDLKENEKRPVVVCQHGLEGRPQDIVQGDHYAYHDFAAKLAEQGFITFSPQNLYIFKDRFRTLQRKANSIGKTLFSVIVPQHQQIVNWLKTLSNVDEKRIAFYGLSYGGKSAMRIPPLVKDYCLSICSADFNDWIWKNASTSSDYSYVWTGEYEIFEFDLGNTFNYTEMAALIAPRPFMVERGHFDGVSSDERVAYEFAKVRHLYQAKLGIGDRCEIEFFVGPHTINGKGTYDFLRKHLDWPAKK